MSSKTFGRAKLVMTGATLQSARIDVGTTQGGTLGARMHVSRDVT